MDHWQLQAHRWALLGPPLRPSAEDAAIVHRELEGWRAPRVLVLGVTQELVELPWPSGTELVAVDRNPAMIETRFHAAPGRRAELGDWRALAHPDASFDLIVGDGCASMLSFPHDVRALFDELARVLAPRGRVVMRAFAAPEQHEVLDARTRTSTFDALKLRIAMSATDADHNVPVPVILERFDALFPDRAALARETGWRREVIDHIDIYRESTATYSFPPLAALRAVLPSSLHEIALHRGSYELADRCPTLVLGRR